MKRSLVAISLLTLIASFASRTEAQPFSLIYRNAVWSKKEIRICFGEASHFHQSSFPRTLQRDPDEKNNPEQSDLAPVTEKYRTLIRKTVDAEFTPERTGIHFTGWKPCSPDAAEADVILYMGSPQYKSSSLLGMAAIGENLESDRASKCAEEKAFVYLKHPDARTRDDKGVDFVATSEEAFRITTLHEFGHLAGLGHEHTRVFKDEADRNCGLTDEYYPSNYAQPWPMALGEHVDVTGPYDRNSIMNYCWMDIIETVTGTKFIIDHSLEPFVPGDPWVVSRQDDPTVSRILADRPKKSAAGVLPPDSILLTDPTLYTERKLDDHRTLYRIRIGLSAGDLHAIRCMYVYDETTVQAQCRLPPLPAPKKLKPALPLTVPTSTPELLKPPSIQIPAIVPVKPLTSSL